MISELWGSVSCGERKAKARKHASGASDFYLESSNLKDNKVSQQYQRRIEKPKNPNDDFQLLMGAGKYPLNQLLFTKKCFDRKGVWEVTLLIL